MGYCTSCGTQLEEDARFCGACGTPIALGQTPAPMPAVATPTPTEVTPPAITSRHRKFAWATFLEILLWVGTFGALAATLGEMNGQVSPGAGGRSAFGQAALMLGLCGYVAAKRRDWRMPWAHAVVWFLSTFLFVAGVRFVSRYSEEASILYLLSSLEKFEPETAHQLKTLDLSADQARLALQPTFIRALMRVPDSELVAFNNIRLSMISASTNMSIGRCAKAARGEAGSQFTRTEKERLYNAMGKIFEAAAPYARAASRTDELHAAILFEPIQHKIDPTGLFDEPEKLNALPDADLCNKYLGLMREINALPPTDAAIVLRAMMTK